MGLLDSFGDLDEPAGGSGTLGLLSKQDRLMALFQGLTQMGATMAQPGMSGWQGFAQGLGGFGQGMAKGNQQALQQRLFLEKLMEQKKQKEARAALAADPRYAAHKSLIEAAPEQFFKSAAENALPKDHAPQVVAPGSHLVGRDGKPIFQAPAAPKDWQDPEYIKAQQAIRAAGKPSMSVNLSQGPQFGTIPPGHVLRQNPDGSYAMAPIDGSPAAREVAKEQEAKGEAQAQRSTAADVVSQDIRRTLELMDKSTLPTTGAAGSVVAKVGGTGAHDVSKLLDTVKANTAFDKLAEMRKASPTGAALGSVTERELALLSAVRGNLEQSQSDEQLRRNLIRLHNVTMDVVHGPGKGPERLAEPAAAKPPGGDKPPAGATPFVGQTARNKKTGEKRVWDGKAWVPVR